MYDLNDTITAISTAPYEGGIGIIRMSGDKSLEILNSIFTSKITEPNLLTYGHIKDGDRVIDEVMACFMKAPKSYTKEDVCEIQCHGGIIAIRKILELTIKHGARLADRGEFTKRAFLNGRLDLSQAEAVIDIINAKTDKELEISINQLSGKFSEKIRDIRKNIMNSLVDITVNIDYPDEDIEELTYDKLRDNLNLAIKDIDSLLKTFDTGKILKDGLNVAIIGKPNTGKSSLMNALLKKSRAIVTEIPGTTRDVISENMVISDIPINLIDTAGIRDTSDIIEKIGIEKSRVALKEADLVILMLDSSRALTNEDYEIINEVKDKKVIYVINKVDLKREADLSKLNLNKVVEMSLKEEVGIKELSDLIENYVYNGEVKKDDTMLLTNLRHKELLDMAYNSLRDALNIINLREPLEVIEIDVNDAYVNLGEIIGEEVKEDIIDEVFKRFCLGK